jgi:citrate synthase
MSTNRTANFAIDGKNVEFPVMSGTHGNDVVDIRTLGAKTGLFTYDPGFLSTASCQSKVTYIDGDKGELLYRGYPIEQLAAQCNFLEVAYLLKNGELPNGGQKEKFEGTIKRHTMVHEQLVKFYQGFRRDAHPMAVMVGVVGALAAFYHDAHDFSDAEHRSMSFNRLVAKMPTIVAMTYKYSVGQPFMHPRNDLDYTANFMQMMFGTPAEEYKPNPGVGARTGCHFHAACGPRAKRLYVNRALWRARRGRIRLPVFLPVSRVCGGRLTGAPMRPACKCWKRLAMFRAWVNTLTAPRIKHDSFKLMGFGHRVYKNFDPRAKLMSKVCADVLSELGLENDRLFKLAKELGEELRWKTTISLKRNCIRMLIFTQVLCKRRWVSQRPCSPAFLLWRGPLAG